MVGEGLIAEPYARALIEVAKSEGCFESVVRDMSDLQTIASELEVFLSIPIADNQKKELLTKTLHSELNLNPITLKFLLVLIDRRRTKILKAIIEKFLNLIWAAEGIKFVKVQSVIPLSYEQEESLINRLKNVIGCKEIQLFRELEDNILGGIVLQIDSQIIDLSLRGRLMQLSDILGAGFKF